MGVDEQSWCGATWTWFISQSAASLRPSVKPPIIVQSNCRI